MSLSSILRGHTVRWHDVMAISRNYEKTNGMQKNELDHKWKKIKENIKIKHCTATLPCNESARAHDERSNDNRAVYTLTDDE